MRRTWQGFDEAYFPYCTGSHSHIVNRTDIFYYADVDLCIRKYRMMRVQ